MMKYKLLILFCFVSIIASAQGYNPGSHITAADAIFPSQKTPLNGRTMYYDVSLFAYRDFQNTTEVLTNLTTAASRFGAALICVHQGGTLSGATFTGGVRMLYWFRNGIADSNLVKFPTDTTAASAAFLIANNLSEGNPTTIKTNLSLQNVDNTSDVAKWAATATLTNKTISGLSNTLTNIGNGSLANSSIGLTLTATGTDVSIPVTPAALGSALTINIPTSTPSVRGVLQGSDFNYFKNKIDSVHVSADSIYDCIAGVCTFRGFITAGSGGGITSLNGLTSSSQSFATGTSGSDFNIVSGTSTHTFNFPNSSGSNRGLLTNTDWTTFNNKQSVIAPSNTIGQYWNGYEQFVALNTDSITEGSIHLFYTNTRARAAISLTTTGSSGAATYNNSTGVLNIPNYSGGGGTVTGFNNGLSLSGSFGQLGGSPLLQNTTISARNLYKFTLDSLGAGLYLNKLKGQTNPTASYKLLLSDTSDNGQVYTGTLSLFDSTGASTLSTPYLFFNTATNTIQVTGLPVGPWIKVGNITSTQATTDTVIVGSILFPKGKFNTPGIQIDGAITGKNTVTFGGSDTLQNDTTLITATAAGSFYHKHMVTTVDGGGLGFGFGAHMHKWDWTNANISVNASNYINEFTYRENAANGSTRDFIPNILYTPSVGSGDSLRSAYAFLTQLSNPVGNLGSVGIGHLVGTGNYPNVHGAYGIYDDNFTVGGPHEAVHSNLVWGPNNRLINGTGGAQSYLNWTQIDSIKIFRPISANGTASLIGIGSTDSLLGKIILGTNLSMSGNTLNATGSGGSGVNTVKKTITQTAHGFTVNEPIYQDTTANTWHPADTINFAMAIVDSIINANTFEVTFEGTYNNTAHGLAPGKYYYVTMPAGSTTTIPPTKNQPVFVPIDANTIKVHLYRPVDFSGTGVGAQTVGTFSTVSILNGASISGSVITFGPADATNPGMIKASGNQTLGDTLTIPGLLLTNLTSGATTDSVLTEDVATGRVHRRFFPTGGSGSQTLQQVFNQQVGGAVLTKGDTVLQGGFFWKFKGGQVFADTMTINNTTHTATQKFQVVGGTYTDFINTDLNTVAGSASTMEMKQLNLNPAATQPFKLTFQNGGVNTFNASMTGNGTGVLGTQYFYLGINSAAIATPVSAYSGGSIQFDSRLLPVMKFYTKYAGATADSLAMQIDTNAVVSIGSLGQVLGAGALQSYSATKPQLGLLSASGAKAIFRVNLSGSLDISALTGLTINSSALPTGTTSDSVLVETTSGNIATVKKVAQSSIGGGAVTSVSNSDGTLTISPTTGAVVGSIALGHANTWTGKQTQPAPIFTGTTSAGANDSVLTIDPATGQVHWRTGTINLTFYNGVHASPTLDSVLWGGTLNQTTTIAGAGFTVGLGTSGSHLGGLSIYSDGGTTINNGKYQSAQGSEILGAASTINNAVTAASGSVTNFSAYAFLAPTVTSTNASVSYTNPATLRIDNSPTMSTNSSASGLAYALDVVAGVSHFGSIVNIDGSLGLGTGGNSSHRLVLGASTTGIDQIYFTNGVDISSVSTGSMWYNGTNLYMAGADNIKRDILTGINNYQHTIFTPSTGGTVALVLNQYNIINPSGTLATLTVNLPSSPRNNDVVYIKYTQSVTVVTYGNGTVVDGITAPTAGGLVILTYDSGTTSWY